MPKNRNLNLLVLSAPDRGSALSLLLVTLLLPQAALAGADKPIVAVFDLETRGLKLNRKTQAIFSDYLADKLAASGSFLVVPRDQLKQRLATMKKTTYQDCYAQSCQIAIGQELAAQKSLASKLMKIGGKCLATLTLYDLKKATTERGGTASGQCSDEALLASLDDALKALMGAPAAPAGRTTSPDAAKAPPLRASWTSEHAHESATTKEQRPTSGAAEYAAQAAFELAEQELQEFLKKRIKGAVSALKAQETRMAREAIALKKKYDQIWDYKRARWTLAAMFRAGTIYEHFARSVAEGYRAAPMPAQVKRLGQEAMDIYMAQLDELLIQQVTPLEEKAKQLYDACVKRAKDFGVSNKYTEEALQRLNALDPMNYPLLKQPSGQSPRKAASKPAPRAVAAPDHSLPDTLSQSQIQGGMKRIKAQVEGCYERFRTPGLALTHVVIGQNGRISSVRVKGVFAGTPTGACVESAVRAASFAKFKGQFISIEYPFLLR